MNKANFLFSALCLIFLLNSCVKDDCTRMMTYTKFDPVYKTYDEIRVDPVVEPARDLINPGKIYLFGSMILVNEIDEGVHVIDNSNPASPVKLAFIAIPGNVDIAMSGTILYADNYVDLLAIDIADVQNIRLKKRVNDAFPNFGAHPDKGVIVKYDAREVTEEVKCSEAGNPGRMTTDMLMAQNMNSGGVSAASGGGSREAIGIGGSMARFAVISQNLYVVDNTDLHVYDINVTDNPTRVNQLQVGWGWGIETIFPYQDKLFIGSNTGMFIYDNSDPQNPTYMSQFMHADVCDPVFVDGNFAYVTLRSGTRCQDFQNQLDVVDISDLMNPSLVSSTSLTNPQGLSVSNEKLYLCDGRDGLKVFDVADKFNIGQNQLFHDGSFSAYDAITIPNANILLVVGEDGFFQYNTTSPASLQLLSHIPVQK